MVHPGNESTFSRWLKMCHVSVVVMLVTLIVLNILKTYLFLYPKSTAYAWEFWNRGTVRREYEFYLILLTNVSWMILALCFLLALSSFLILTLRVGLQPYLHSRCSLRCVCHFLLLVLTAVIVYLSWDGVVP